MEKKRYSVLTYSIGDYERVKEVLNPKSDVEYIYVTDNKSITSSTWTVKYVDNPHPEDPFYMCYDIRFNPFKYVNTDIVMRIDGSMKIVDDTDLLVNEFISGDYDIMLMAHPSSQTLVEEYKAWEDYRGYPHERSEKILSLIRESGFDVDNYHGIYQGGFTIQRNNEANNHLNKKTLEILTALAPEGKMIERVDQTIWSYVANRYHSDMKVMVVDYRVFNGHPILMWWHGDDENMFPPMYWGKETTPPMLFNHEVTIFYPY